MSLFEIVFGPLILADRLGSKIMRWKRISTKNGTCIIDTEYTFKIEEELVMLSERMRMDGPYSVTPDEVEQLEALNAELVALVTDLYQFRKRDYPNDITFDERVAKARGESCISAPMN